MSNIVVLPRADNQPDTDCVEFLRDMLTRAERGEITGVAIVTVDAPRDGLYRGIGTAWAGEGVHGNVHTALGGIEVLRARFVKEKFEGL